MTARFLVVEDAFDGTAYAHNLVQRKTGGPAEKMKRAVIDRAYSSLTLWLPLDKTPTDSRPAPGGTHRCPAHQCEQ